MRQFYLKALLLLFLPALFMAASRKPREFSIHDIERNLNLIPGAEVNFEIPSIFSKSFRSAPDSGEKFIIDSFYISRFETSNFEYLAFLNELKQRNDTATLRRALWDSLNWNRNPRFGEPYMLIYQRHPAYYDHPVVNVNHEGALLYCNWVTEKYNAWPRRKFNKVIFRLPSEKEWMLAAKGKENYTMYPFKGIRIRNEKGEWMANFLAVDQSGIYVQDSLLFNPLTSRYDVIKIYRINPWPEILGFKTNELQPVYSLGPQNSGLYNMAGNVSEMVSEKGISKGGGWNSTGYYLRVLSRETYNDSLNRSATDRGFRIAMEVLVK